jgi:hypothetical protein
VQEYGSGGLSRYFCPRVWMENKPPPVGQQPLSLTQFLLGEVCQQLTDQTRPDQLLARFFVDAAKYIRLHQELFGNYGPGGLMLQVLCKCQVESSFNNSYGFFFYPGSDPGSRGQKSTEAQIRIRNTALKVHKIENFFDSNFGICVISLLVMHK